MRGEADEAADDTRWTVYGMMVNQHMFVTEIGPLWVRSYGDAGWR